MFDFLKKPKLKEPCFLKADSSAEKQLAALQNLAENAPADVAARIQADIRMLNAGMEGEKNIAYELKTSFLPIYIFHDLFLQYKDLTAQIDYLVIHKNYVLVIESKKMLGDMEITSKGDFIRVFKTPDGHVYKKEGIYSPVVQNERHCAILKQILYEVLPKAKPALLDAGVKSVVVLANPKSIVFDKYAKKEVKSQIIKFDQLRPFMEQLAKTNSEAFILSEESQKKLCDRLLELHRENPVDYTLKYQKQLAEKSPTETDKSTGSKQNEALRAALKKYRLDVSRAENIKPYFLFNNAQMEELIAKNPKTLDELCTVAGFGEKKSKLYGETILQILKRFHNENETDNF